MRKIILLIVATLLLAVCSHSARAQFTTTSHSGVTWDRYRVTGSIGADMGFGTGLQDSTRYAPYNSSFRAGYFGLNKGTIINTPANRGAIPSPLQGMLAYDTTAKAFYGYNGLNWVRFDSTGGGGTDTAAIYYQLGLRVKYTDTAAMLANYARESALADTAADIRADFPTAVDTTSLSNRINLKLNSSDTANLSARINLRQPYSDTASTDATRYWVQQNYQPSGTYLTGPDTVSLSNRINLKLTSTDTANLSARINLKLNSSDTASLSSRVNLKLNSADTASLSNRINLKLNITDTTNKWLPIGYTQNTLTIVSPLTGTSYNGSSAVNIGIPAASSSVNGYLSSTDWNTFNGKLGSGAYTATNLSLNSGKLLGRTTPLTGLAEEITPNATLTFASAALGLNLSNANTWLAAQTFNPIILTGQASPTYAAGKLVYDTDNESLTFYNNNSAVALQVGQEEWIRVVNNTGSSISNGVPVYISGASGGLPTIAPANASAAATTICAGLTTNTIANGAIGYVTCIGLVRDINTAAFAAGSTVFVGTSAGTLTNTAPTSPNYRMRVGIVGTSNASTGTIHVTPSTAALGNGPANYVSSIGAGGTQEYHSVGGAKMEGIYTLPSVSLLGTGNTAVWTMPAGQGDYIVTQAIVTVLSVTGAPAGTLSADIRYGTTSVCAISLGSGNTNAVGKVNKSTPTNGLLVIPAGSVVNFNIGTPFTTATVLTARVDVKGYYTN